MAKSENQKSIIEEQVTVNNERFVDEMNEENSTTQLPIAIGTNSTIVLMPELEELVKKNPNRLIGCGG